MYLLFSHCVLSTLQYHVTRNDEALMYNDSTEDLHKLCKNPVNSLRNSLSAWLLTRGILAASSSFPAKSYFYMERPSTNEWLSPPQPHACL